MASSLALSTPRLLTAEEFFQIDFGPDLKAELDNGVIRMMAGGSRDHARVQANILAFLHGALRGSPCRTYGSDMAVQTRETAVRYPDASVDCGRSGDTGKDVFLSAPRVVVEVLSPSTRDHDLLVKKAEYREVATIDTIAFVDPEAGLTSVSQRTADGWTDTAFAAADVAMPSLGIVVPLGEIFA